MAPISVQKVSAYFGAIASKIYSVVRKNLNAAKPPSLISERSKGLGGNIVGKALHGIERVPQCYHIGSTV